MRWLKAGLVATALALMALGATPSLADQSSVLYWQCVAPGAGSSNGGYCPVSSGYPLPTTATFAGGPVSITAPLDAGGSLQVSPFDIGGTSMTNTGTHSLNVFVVNNGVLAEASSTGATYAPIGGLVATAAPTFTNGKLDPFSLTTAGGVRTDLDSLNAVTILTGNGVTGTGSMRVTVASDNSAIPAWGHGATGSAVPAGATYMGANSAGNLTGIIQASANAAVSVSTATTTQIIPASGSTKIYVTHWHLVTTLANNVTWESADTGGACANPVTLTGAEPFAANGGVSAGSGLGPVLVTPAGKALCMVTSASTQISGTVAYTQF